MGKSTSIYNPNIEKNPHIQRFRCMWGFQKGEDKYLTLSLVQSILLFSVQDKWGLCPVRMIVVWAIPRLLFRKNKKNKIFAIFLFAVLK